MADGIPSCRIYAVISRIRIRDGMTVRSPCLIIGYDYFYHYFPYVKAPLSDNIAEPQNSFYTIHFIHKPDNGGFMFYD